VQALHCSLLSKHQPLICARDAWDVPQACQAQHVCMSRPLHKKGQQKANRHFFLSPWFVADIVYRKTFGGGPIFLLESLGRGRDVIAPALTRCQQQRRATTPRFRPAPGAAGRPSGWGWLIQNRLAASMSSILNDHSIQAGNTKIR
jgi:hypothetical protein